jgi:hypothetical protein
MLGPGPAVLAWGALGMASVVIATVAVASLGALLAIRSPTLRVRQEKHRVARKPSGLRRANEIAHPSSRMSCWQIPDGVGDRVRPQVALHELAEKLDDWPWAREQPDAFDLSGSILCYEDGDLDQVAVDAPVECDDVSSVGVLEFLDIAGHPIASECCPKDLDFMGCPRTSLLVVARIGE